MGKKSRKKKTGKPAVRSSPEVVAAAAVAEAVAGRDNDAMILPTGKNLPLPSSCFHGSNLAAFENHEYAGVMQAYILMVSEVYEIGRDNSLIATQRYTKFRSDHNYLMNHDADFCCFIFAYCAHLYLKYDLSSAKYKAIITQLLTLGVTLRYINQAAVNGVDVHPGSENVVKWNKYCSDIPSERGVIKCLARETPCNCMHPKKAEAKGMDKTNVCNDCRNHFPKTSLSFCTGCQIAKYCSKACQVSDWPRHRALCKTQGMKINEIDK